MIKPDIWTNCYIEMWKGFIVDEAFSHPAKFSHALIGKIYDHALKNAWVKKGDTVLDPFGGVALGALHSLINGLNWIGIELELKFVSLGQQNIDLWTHKYREWPHLGTAKIIQGDSRRIKEVVKEAGLIVSSPPFFLGTHQGDSEKLIKAIAKKYRNNSSRLDGTKKYDPFPTEMNTPGNLANMKEGEFDLVCSSPPWEKCLESGGGIKVNKLYDGMVEKWGRSGSEADRKKQVELMSKRIQGRKYGEGTANLGNESGDTFWSASKKIVQGCYELLKPGGHAVWVVKDYVKAGKIVPFSDRWASLCMSVGFKSVCWHHASLVQNHGWKMTLDGKEEEISTERKSFFRRLAEKKGSPRIDHESVICMRK